MNKNIFLDHLQKERDKFELLLNRVGFTRTMTVKGVIGNWSIKDIIAHVWAYEQFISDRLNEVKHGEMYKPCETYKALDIFLAEFGYPDFGSALLNNDSTPSAWIYEKYKNISLEEIVAQELEAYTSIVSALEGMPEHLMKEHHLMDQVAKHTYFQYQKYTKAIRGWLKSHSAKTKKI